MSLACVPCCLGVHMLVVTVGRGVVAPRIKPWYAPDAAAELVRVEHPLGSLAPLLLLFIRRRRGAAGVLVVVPRCSRLRPPLVRCAVHTPLKPLLSEVWNIESTDNVWISGTNTTQCCGSSLDGHKAVQTDGAYRLAPNPWIAGSQCRGFSLCCVSGICLASLH